MADEVKTEQVAQEVTESPTKSIREEVEDQLTEFSGEAPAEPQKESAEEVSDEAKEIADEVVPGEEEAAEDEISKVLKEEPDKDVTPGVQKRIDRLTAEKKALEERLARIEASQKPKDANAPRYSNEQLMTALKKGVSDGDADLVSEAVLELMKNQKHELVSMYESEKKAAFESVNAIQTEWKETVDAYSKYADTKVPEIWPGSHKDLNLRDGTSLLYQVAMMLYSSDDPQKAAYYRQPGGQKLAVADALTKILSIKTGSKVKDSEKEKLKKQLIKEKRKKSIVGGGSSGAEEKAPARFLSDSERLEEVLAERRKYQEERAI